NTSIEGATRRAQFLSICKFLMLAKGKMNFASQIAREQGAPPLVVNVLKTAINPQTLSSLQDFRLVVDAFVDGLASVGVFDAILAGGAVRAPLSSTVGAVTTLAVGYTVAEGSAKQVSRLSLSNGTLTPAKAHSVVTISNEVLKISGAGSLNLLQRQLTK